MLNIMLSIISPLISATCPTGWNKDLKRSDVTSQEGLGVASNLKLFQRGKILRFYTLSFPQRLALLFSA